MSLHGYWLQHPFKIYSFSFCGYGICIETNKFCCCCFTLPKYGTDIATIRQEARILYVQAKKLKTLDVDFEIRTLFTLFLVQQYRPIKTTTRNYETHKTWNADERSDRTRNHERRNKNLSLGFFSDRTKPYQPLGTVLLDDGDLLLESITDDVRAKVSHRQT